jgi:uncharacterized phage-associated protein
VWDDAPLFDEPIQAWANGPVSPALYDVHRGEYLVTLNMVEGKQDGQLSAEQIETIDTVLNSYGDKSAQWLSDQTHAEAPWANARSGLSDMERGTNVIKHNAIAEYYGSL